MNEWLDHPLLKNMDPLKLELIKTAAGKTQGKSGRSLAPIMMSRITGAQKNGIRVTPEEMSLVISILKEDKPKEEQEQIDAMLKMVMGYAKKQS